MIRRLVERLTEKIDGPLFALVCCVLVIGLATLYSAAYQAPGRVGAQALNVLLALALMWVAAQVPPQVFMRYALPAFVLRRVVRRREERRAPMASPGIRQRPAFGAHEGRDAAHARPVFSPA